MEQVIVVIAIIIGGGLLGGLAAFLVEREGSAQAAAANTVAPSLLRFLVMGIVASACVPLFLSLVKSGLFDNMIAAKGAENSFIFAGLCLIAAFVSRQFLDTVSRQLIRQVERLDERTKEVEETTQDVKDAMAEEGGETIPETPAPEAVPELSPGASASLPIGDETERRVLRAAGNKRYRNSAGISLETGIARPVVRQLMQSLKDKGLLAIEVNPATGKYKWMITDAGRSYLK